MSMRTVTLEARDAHYRMIKALEEDVKRPKVRLGLTKASSRSVASDYTQPVGLRRSGFQHYVQNPEGQAEVKAFDKAMKG